MTMVKLTMIKAVNVNQFRLFIVIIKNALKVSEIVIFIKSAHGRNSPPCFSQAARRPSPPLPPPLFTPDSPQYRLNYLNREISDDFGK